MLAQIKAFFEGYMKTTLSYYFLKKMVIFCNLTETLGSSYINHNFVEENFGKNIKSFIIHHRNERT